MASPSSGRTFTGERVDEDVSFTAWLKAARAVFRFRVRKTRVQILLFSALSCVIWGTCINLPKP